MNPYNRNLHTLEKISRAFSIIIANALFVRIVLLSNCLITKRIYQTSYINDSTIFTVIKIHKARQFIALSVLQNPRFAPFTSNCLLFFILVSDTAFEPEVIPLLITLSYCRVKLYNLLIRHLYLSLNNYTVFIIRVTSSEAISINLNKVF